MTKRFHSTEWFDPFQPKMMRPPPLRQSTLHSTGDSAPHVQPLAMLLERDSAFARLALGVEHMIKLTADISCLLPAHLAPHISSGPVREGVLTLFAAHGALAARLRHLEPQLLQDLQQRGWAIHALRIRIRPHAPATPSAPKTARISSTALSFLDKLRQQLAPSPLQTAVARLINRHHSPLLNKEENKKPSSPDESFKHRSTPNHSLAP